MPIRYAALLAVVAACVPSEALEADYYRQLETGIALENRCIETSDPDHCAAWYAFKTDFESDGSIWETVWRPEHLRQ